MIGFKPFLTNKISLSSESITIKDKDKFIDEEKELAEIFNNYYINIVEKKSGKPVENSFAMITMITLTFTFTITLKQFSKSLRNTKNTKVF